jgi:hypothetical protein
MRPIRPTSTRTGTGSLLLLALAIDALEAAIKVACSPHPALALRKHKASGRSGSSCLPSLLPVAAGAAVVAAVGDRRIDHRLKAAGPARSAEHRRAEGWAVLPPPLAAAPATAAS